MLSVYDLLGQRKNISRTVNASYIDDVAYNSLTRYGMITFTYRFSSFKRGQEPTINREFNGGPGGPGGRRGPGGPGGGGGRRPW